MWSNICTLTGDIVFMYCYQIARCNRPIFDCLVPACFTVFFCASEFPCELGSKVYDCWTFHVDVGIASAMTVIVDTYRNVDAYMQIAFAESFCGYLHFELHFTKKKSRSVTLNLSSQWLDISHRDPARPPSKWTATTVL